METRKSLIPTNEDRISNLPETLIHHILSFLDMKSVVETSVLSKRWRYIWTSVPTLNFDYNMRHGWDLDGFQDFVDMVLILNDRSDLQRFNLEFCEHKLRDEVAKRVHTWILGALRRNVQELYVCFSGGDMSFQIPQCLFNSKSVTKLKLELHMGGYKQEKTKIVFPKSMDLPLLKSLKLYDVSIDDVDVINKLFSTCPVLESLIVERCDIATGRLINIDIHSVKLKHFQLTNCYDTTIKCMRLYAPNLRSFVCKDCHTQDYYLENLSSMVTADVDLGKRDDPSPKTYSKLSAEDKEVYCNRMMKLLTGLRNVKELRLSYGFLEVVAGATDLLNSQFLQLCNLQCLELLTSSFSRRYLGAITCLLKISPNLKSLSLGTYSHRYGEEEEDWEAESSLSCMLLHLKFLEVSGAEGSFNDLKFLEILLKNAMILDEVVLHSWDRDITGLTKFAKKLKTFLRASSIILINVND